MEQKEIFSLDFFLSWLLIKCDLRIYNIFSYIFNVFIVSLYPGSSTWRLVGSLMASHRHGIGRVVSRALISTVFVRSRFFSASQTTRLSPSIPFTVTSSYSQFSPFTIFPLRLWLLVPFHITPFICLHHILGSLTVPSPCSLTAEDVSDV